MLGIILKYLFILLKKQNSSENAFIIRKKGEYVSKKNSQLDVDVRKLTEKRDYLLNLISTEKNRFGNLKEENTDAHIKMRNMQVSVYFLWFWKKLLENPCKKSSGFGAKRSQDMCYGKKVFYCGIFRV